MTSKKPFWVEIVEKEIKRLNDGIKRLDDRMNKMGDALTSLISLTVEQNEITSRLRFLAVTSASFSKGGFIQNIASLLEDEKALANRFKFREGLKDMVFDGLKKRLPLYVTLAKMKDIGFDDFAALLIKKLGVNLAREVVPLDEFVRHFGVESADAWKKLVKK